MKILFVCTGNTCRSCMAEAIFNAVSDNDEILVLSAGTNAIEGSKTSLNTALMVKEKIHIDISNRKAVQLTADLIKEADLILTMTKRIRNLLLMNFNNLNSNIYALSDYVGIEGEIIDPFGMNLNTYSKTYEQLNSLIYLLIEKIKKDSNL